VTVEPPYDRERLDEVVRLRRVMEEALDRLAEMPPRDEAVKLAATARQAWDRISALFRLDEL